MTYGVLALTVAAGLGLSSAALAKPHCPVGEIYHRSKHICLAKEVAIDRGIYHSRHHIAAEGDGTTSIHRRARPRAAAPGLVLNGTASAPARTGDVASIGSVVPPAPETARRSLVPVTPTE